MNRIGHPSATSGGPTYQVVLADPPWAYYGSGTKMAAAAKHYDCVGFDDMVELARPPLARPGVYFQWTTSAKLAESLKLLELWGLAYRGVAFVWVKTRADGQVIGAQGVRPSITKPTTELVIAASWAAKGRPLPLADEGVAQVVLAPRREHSRKPDEVQARIERLYPQASKLEMFARTRRPGWDAMGNQTDLFAA